MVVIAGGPGCSHTYIQPFLASRIKDHRLIFYDAFGRGKSDRAKDPGEYTFERDVRDLEGLREALAIEQWVVMGHSYGGMLAQAYALRHPGRVRKLVVADSLHSAEMWDRSNLQYLTDVQLQCPEAWAALAKLREAGKRSSDPEHRKLLLEVVPEGLFYLYNPDNSISSLQEFNFDVYYAMAGEDADIKLGGSLAGLDFRERLQELRMPILIVAGRYDRISRPNEALLFKQYAPQAKFVMFEKSGHLPFMEENEKFIEVLTCFLGSAQNVETHQPTRDESPAR